MSGNVILSVDPNFKSGGLEYAVARIEGSGVIRVLLEDKTADFLVREMVRDVAATYGVISAVVFDKWSSGIVFDQLNELGLRVVSPIANLNEFMRATESFEKLGRSGELVGLSPATYVAANAVLRALEHKSGPITFCGEL